MDDPSARAATRQRRNQQRDSRVELLEQLSLFCARLSVKSDSHIEDGMRLILKDVQAALGELP